jgi:hypoxanthine phosphoribosyltransferase
MLSHYLEVPLQTLNVSLRDSELGPESNLWMAEEAFGYVPTDEQETLKSRWDISRRKNILIVDDINDSGATLQWIKDDWQSGCLPNETTAWNSVWNKSVRFAVLVNNQASNFKDVDYVGKEINKLETPAWVVFPWENWWEN